jgi:hypothetical protein
MAATDHRDVDERVARPHVGQQAAVAVAVGIARALELQAHGFVVYESFQGLGRCLVARLASLRGVDAQEPNSLFRAVARYVLGLPRLDRSLL